MHTDLIMSKSKYHLLALLIIFTATVDSFRTHFHKKSFQLCKVSETGGIELADNPLMSENVESSLRKWYLIKHKRRPDMVSNIINLNRNS